MSYFIDDDRGFGVYTSPFAGEDALRTLIYYAGSGEAKASTALDFYYGTDEVSTSLKEWGFTSSLYKKSSVSKNICLYRNPCERFISTYYMLRVSNNIIGDTLDNFLNNFDTFMEDDTLKYIFATQTAHLGSSKEAYSTAITYRNHASLNSFLTSKWEVSLPKIQLPNTKEPCPFTGHSCEFDLTTRQKNKVKEIYAEDYDNGWV